MARMARQRLGNELAWTWRPGDEVPGFERNRRGKVDKSLVEKRGYHSQKTVPPPCALTTTPSKKVAELVTLSPDADPAYAAWILDWEARTYGSGQVYLPFGDHIVLGRSPDAHVCVALDALSWKHVVFSVSRDHVVVMDRRSSNGSQLLTAESEDTLLPDRRRHMEPGDRLRLADAITLELKRVEP